MRRKDMMKYYHMFVVNHYGQISPIGMNLSWKEAQETINDYKPDVSLRRNKMSGDLIAASAWHIMMVASNSKMQHTLVPIPNIDK